VDHGGPLRSGFGWKLSQRQTGTTTTFCITNDILQAGPGTEQCLGKRHGCRGGIHEGCEGVWVVQQGRRRCPGILCLPDRRCWLSLSATPGRAPSRRCSSWEAMILRRCPSRNSRAGTRARTAGGMNDNVSTA
jgi:hypothetical protein